MEIENVFDLNNDNEFYLVSKKILPKIMLSVMKVKKLIDNDKNISVATAVKKIGISRSSYYKYCSYIHDINKTIKNKITLHIQVKNIIGSLSHLTQIISKNKYNILTITQPASFDDKNDIIITIEVEKNSNNINSLLKDLEASNQTKFVEIISTNE